MSQTMPSSKSLFGGGQDDKNKKAGGLVGMGFGMPAGIGGFNDQYQGKYGRGQNAEFLNPKDWSNGSIKDEMTGDTPDDMKFALSKYGLFAAPWAPAYMNESKKKGSDLRAQASAEAAANQRSAQFAGIQPYDRGAGEFQGQNPYTTGGYNDTAGMLGGQASIGQPMGQQQGYNQQTQSLMAGNPASQQLPTPGGLSPNTVDPQLLEWLKANMGQANASQMGGLL